MNIPHYQFIFPRFFYSISTPFKTIIKTLLKKQLFFFWGGAFVFHIFSKDNIKLKLLRTSKN